MELFVFMRMGGNREDIDVRLLEETTNLAVRLTSFDAGAAKCFLDRDRQKLLAVIEATFGTFSPFNKLVRELFKKQLRSSNLLPGSPLAVDETTRTSVSISVVKG